MTCELCGDYADEGGLCKPCKRLVAESENDIAAGRVQDASDAFAELDADMRQEENT